MKILFIAQLVLLAIQVATAIAAAFVSFGASTAAIPAFIAATRVACTRLLRKVVDDVIKKGITRLLTRARALLKKVAVRSQPRIRFRTHDSLAAVAHRVDYSAITPTPAWRADTRALYRNDQREMEEVFRDGFRAWNHENVDLVRYVHFNEQSAFVGSSYRSDIAMGGRYTYEIEAPGGIDVNRSIDNPFFRDEEEIAFPGGIHRRFIKGGWEVDPRTGGPTGGFVANPNFHEKRPR